jgi:hypothetical protein
MNPFAKHETVTISSLHLFPLGTFANTTKKRKATPVTGREGL